MNSETENGNEADRPDPVRTDGDTEQAMHSAAQDGQQEPLQSLSIWDELRESPVTDILVLTNVLIWIVLELIGDTTSARFIYECGGLWPDSIRYDGQYWRLITCTFLHFGASHLVNNMILLFFLGREAERAVGHFRFLLIYLLAGTGGSLVSYHTMVRTGDEAVAAGASGAVFGLMGLILIVLLVHKGRYERFTMKRLALMIGLSLYFGFVSGGVDNAGHVGGLCSGILITFFFYGIPYIVKASCNRKN